MSAPELSIIINGTIAFLITAFLISYTIAWKRFQKKNDEWFHKKEVEKNLRIAMGLPNGELLRREWIYRYYYKNERWDRKTYVYRNPSTQKNIEWTKFVADELVDFWESTGWYNEVQERKICDEHHKEMVKKHPLFYFDHSKEYKYIRYNTVSTRARKWVNRNL